MKKTIKEIMGLNTGRIVKILHTVFAGERGRIVKVQSNNIVIVKRENGQEIPVFYESLAVI